MMHKKAHSLSSLSQICASKEGPNNLKQSEPSYDGDERIHVCLKQLMASH